MVSEGGGTDTTKKTPVATKKTQTRRIQPGKHEKNPMIPKYPIEQSYCFMYVSPVFLC